MAYNEGLLSAFFKTHHLAAYHITNLILVKGDGISDQILVVPGVQHFFSGIVVHHGVVAELIGELNVGVPLFSSLGVESMVDGCCPGVIGVNTVDHPTGHKSISH